MVHAAYGKKESLMKNKVSRKSGFTLVEIMIVVAIIGLLAAIAIPNFVRARTTSQMNACINNLRLIDSAKQQWALEQRQSSTSTPVGSDLQPYLGHGSAGELPSCPADSSQSWANSYSSLLGNVSVKPQCSIVGTSHVLP
jgi:prepilin-type N-terminal cleavage/methylation domain-containing protein